MQETLKNFIENKRFTQAITGLILINAVTLGLETSPTVMAAAGGFLVAFDKVILGIFALELLTKLYVYRLSFFKSGWNVFDFIIVAISLLPASGPLSVLRALRILRVLRLFSIVPSMRRVIAGLFNAMPGMASVVGVLFLVFYVAAVLTTKIFGASGDPHMQQLFGSIGASMYTLFQVMTLEDWSGGVVRPAIELYPWAWVFFIPFIIITSFAVLNLFIGVMVDAMQREEKETAEKVHADDKEEIAAIRRDVAQIKKLLEDARR